MNAEEQPVADLNHISHRAGNGTSVRDSGYKNRNQRKEENRRATPVSAFRGRAGKSLS